MRTRGFFASAFAVAASAALPILVGAPGCGSSDVALRSAPGGGAAQAGPDGGSHSPGGSPGGEKPEGPAPASRFWVFCGINSYSQFTTAFDLTVMSSALGPLEHGTSITLVDERTFPPDRPIQALDKNVDSIMAFPAAHVAPYTYRTLFLGRRSFADPAWGLWVTDANLVRRSGRARPIGAGIQPSAGANAAAIAMGGHPRKFGASDQGTYIFIPVGAGSFSVLRSVDFSQVGRIDVGGDAMMPQMDEQSGVFWAWTFGAGGMANRFYSVREADGRLQIASLGSFGGAPQTPAQRLGRGQFAWAEAPGAGSGTVAALTATLATPLARMSQRFSIEDERGPGFFRPMAAGFRMADGTPALVVAEEDIDRQYYPWIMRRGEVRIYRLQGAGAPGGPAVKAPVDGIARFPQPAIDEIQKTHRLAMHHSNFAMTGAWNLPDGSQAVLTMETTVGPMNFRALSLGAGLAKVDGMADEVCQYPASIANPD